MSSLPWLIFLLFPVVSSLSLAERVDELDQKSLELVDKAKVAKKLTRELRGELVTFFLKFVHLHREVIENGEPLLLFKVSRIAARLRAGLRVRLPHIKKRLSKVVAGLLTPILMPWYMIEKSTPPTTTTPAPMFQPSFVFQPAPWPWNWNTRWPEPSNFVDMDYPQFQ